MLFFDHQLLTLIFPQFLEWHIRRISLSKAKLEVKKQTFFFQIGHKLVICQSFQYFTKGKNNSGLQFPNSDRLPRLNIGVTFDILKISGNSPDDIDLLYISVKGADSCSVASLISLLGTIRDTLFSFSPANNVNTCVWITGAR